MGNKKAIVTGASHGIGMGIALRLAAEGYDLAISYNRREAEARELAQHITQTYGTACYYDQATLQNPGVPAAFFEKAVENLGGLDLLVCNAGVTLGGSILDLTEEKLDYAFGVDLKSYLMMSSLAANYMVDHDILGNIIFITSVHGERAFAYDVLYGSAKAALNRAVQSMAIELGNYGIRVNAIAPGYISIHEDNPMYLKYVTELGAMLPLNRIGKPEDVAGAVAFLASEKAKYITGITVRVDGGLILPGMPENNRPEGNVRIWGYHEDYGMRPKRPANKASEKK